MMLKERHAYHQIFPPIQTGEDDDLKHTRRNVVEADPRIEGRIGRGSKGSAGGKGLGGGVGHGREVIVALCAVVGELWLLGREEVGGRSGSMMRPETTIQANISTLQTRWRRHSQTHLISSE
jgi:hypothetical protein